MADAEEMVNRVAYQPQRVMKTSVSNRASRDPGLRMTFQRPWTIASRPLCTHRRKGTPPHRLRAASGGFRHESFMLGEMKKARPGT